MSQQDPSTFEIVMSVLASFIGVQSSKNHNRDSEYLDKKGFKPFLIAGLILTVAFVLIVASVVTLVLTNIG